MFPPWLMVLSMCWGSLAARPGAPWDIRKCLLKSMGANGSSGTVTNRVALHILKHICEQLLWLRFLPETACAALCCLKRPCFPSTHSSRVQQREGVSSLTPPFSRLLRICLSEGIPHWVTLPHLFCVPITSGFEILR